ncbi:39S ribosomal protein L41, mitochondrial [Eupeodes corollae]|uniref:39S ribosomal protein L41, mitochondrial n=1 Tax=Eupeodes corollae TaxID=290404 RepID=UPI002491384F|nr:39S ribosomal protein L41, mitochondrial [Eupeodes corollae]
MEKINKLLAFTVRANQRSISTSAALAGKRNFRKFPTYNKRGTRNVKEAQRNSLNPPVPVYKRGVRDTGVYVNGKFQSIPQRIPQLVVPNLEDCKLKPYVSYKAPDVVQSEFTSLDLYNAVYAQKVIDDFKAGKLAEDGSPLEPSQQELLTPEEALMKARKTGSDIF